MKLENASPYPARLLRTLVDERRMYGRVMVRVSHEVVAGQLRPTEAQRAAKGRPDLEDPEAPIRRWDDRPEPVGTGSCVENFGPDAPLRVEVRIGEDGGMRTPTIDPIGVEADAGLVFVTHRYPFRDVLTPHQRRACRLFLAA